MNKGLLFFFLMFLGTLLHAQNQNSVIDGVTFSADGKTLISYPRDKADKEYVVPEGTEVIGKKAFAMNAYLRKVTFPVSLKEIGDEAFLFTSIYSVMWGNFPNIIGEDIFFGSSVEEFKVSDNSSNCISIDGVLFSINKKTLLLYPRQKMDVWQEYLVTEGTEIIGERAFENAYLSDVVLPSTLKMIKEYAFWVNSPVATRSEGDGLWTVTCNALVPPLINDNSFAEPHRWTDLYVPEDSFEAYYNTFGWKDFRKINERYTSVNNLFVKAAKVWFEDFILNVTSEQRIARVYVYNQIGTLLIEQEVGANSWLWNMEVLYPQGLLLIRVVYDDFTESIFKLVK